MRPGRSRHDFHRALGQEFSHDVDDFLEVGHLAFGDVENILLGYRHCHCEVHGAADVLAVYILEGHGLLFGNLGRLAFEATDEERLNLFTAAGTGPEMTEAVDVGRTDHHQFEFIYSLIGFEEQLFCDLRLP